MKFKAGIDCDQVILDETSCALRVDEAVDDFLIRKRKILLVGEIDEISSTHVCGYLQMFSQSKDPIYLYINSTGGCLASGYAIIDQMLASPGKVYTIVRGQAYSMGALIAAFGSKGCRFITANSSMMLHSVVMQIPQDSIERNKQAFAFIEEDYTNKLKDLAKRVHIKTKQLEMLMKQTCWMNAQSAIDFGLVDSIWTPQMERFTNA